LLYVLLSFLIYFFFQAEDGIRDRNVTGVQTCALPIYFIGNKNHRSFDLAQLLQNIILSGTALFRNINNKQNHIYLVQRTFCSPRSEERRVGKECRSRRARDDDNDKHETR